MTSLLGKEVTVMGRRDGSTFTLPNTFDLPVTDAYHYQTVWYYPLSVIACVTALPPTTTTVPCNCELLCAKLAMIYASAKQQIS